MVDSHNFAHRDTRCLDPCVLQAVIAHELGHLKCSHGVWLTMANVLANNTLSVLPLLSGAIEEGLLRWLRAAELTCDRAALLVAQDHRIVISSLMKLAGGSPKLNAELNVEAFLRQASCFTLLSLMRFWVKLLKCRRHAALLL